MTLQFDDVTVKTINSLRITHTGMQMNLKSTTTNGFNIRIINSLMESWGIRLTWLDCNISKDVKCFQLKINCDKLYKLLWTLQEYPTEPLDKIPALQAEFELAGKKKHWLISWLGNLNERLAS